MDRRNVIQYSLLIILFIASYLFYDKYFVEDNKKVDLNKSENILKEKGAEVNQVDKSKNIIENLKYISEDLLGNTYTVIAQSATLKEDKISEVQLFEVNAEINRQNQEIIYIYSKTASYDKINNNTIFKGKVNVKYKDHTIDSETLNLNFEDNLIEILDNVYYVNKNTKINADKVEIDLLYKKLKISMINKNDKVNITSKY
jgi:lipopolysaccharide assembly outer membrane protein LptD (OstA)